LKFIHHIQSGRPFPRDINNNHDMLSEVQILHHKLLEANYNVTQKQ
jgi:hypothetical protein